MDTVLIGEVLKPHGIKGELKVYPLTHDPNRYKKLKQLFLAKDGVHHQFSIKKVRIYSGMVYLLLDGINTVEGAEAYRGWEVRIDRADVPPLKEGWYHFELEGMDVYEGGQYLGRLTAILETGANDVYVVKGEKGEIYIPALKSVVKKVDVAGKRMDVVLPPGLLEDDEK